MQQRQKYVYLMDLVSEAQMMHRHTFEALWNRKNSIKISSAEWSVIFKAAGQEPTIADIAKALNITRQAAHKCVKSLVQKGLVILAPRQADRRVKVVELTKLGEQCYKKSRLLKKQMEADVCEDIGAEDLAQLKQQLLFLSPYRNHA